MTTKDSYIIFLFYYTGWFGSVLLAKSEFSLLPLIFPTLLLVFLKARSLLSKNTLIFMLILAGIGIAFDSLLLYFEFITAVGYIFLILPIWLISIWLMYSLSMIKLGLKFNLPLWLSATLGFILGPLSYKSGEAFQVLTFSSSHTFLIYAAFWALLFPLTIHVSKRLV